MDGDHAHQAIIVHGQLGRRGSEIHSVSSAARCDLALRRMSRVFTRMATSVVLGTLLLQAWPLMAQAAGAQFVYDPAGRLVQVIAPDGTSAQYSYDLAGNLLAITPLSASNAAVTGFSTSTGAAGGTSTIYGSGFSTNPSDNLVLREPLDARSDDGITT
jgi:YD repeat-containing protein